MFGIDILMLRQITDAQIIISIKSEFSIFSTLFVPIDLFDDKLIFRSVQCLPIYTIVNKHGLQTPNVSIFQIWIPNIMGRSAD